MKTNTCIGTKKLLETMFSDNCQVLSCYVQASVSVVRVSPKELSSDMVGMLEFIETLRYNDFDGVSAVAFIKKHIKDIYTIRFGREYSPVMYFRMAVNTPEKRNAFANAINEALSPDECGWCGEELRVWFD